MKHLSASTILCWFLSTLAAPALAGPGHDHGDTPTATSGDGPQRLPDGSIRLPKAAQHQLDVRTLVVSKASLPRAFELPAEVRLDPDAGGRVQSVFGGRIERPASGLPVVGVAVKAGQVLAYVQPTIAPIDAANQRARLAELGAQRVQAVRHLERMQGLSDSVPQKEIDAALATLAIINGQMGALRERSPGNVAEREALRSPVSGVIAAANVVTGQVVEPREVLFEIVDPRRMLVEARAFDLEAARDIESATLLANGQALLLEYLGSARALREQSLPLTFRAKGDGLSALAVGQPIKVQVQTRKRIEGIPVPRSALVRSPANETIVWLKKGPELFVPQPVKVEPLDGERVMVVAGIEPGMRVVIQAASLVNQIR